MPAVFYDFACPVYYILILVFLFQYFHRRIHITGETLSFLKSDYEVERANGIDRDAFLRDHNIETWFIVTPKAGAIHNKTTNCASGSSTKRNRQSNYNNVAKELRLMGHHK